MCKGSCGELLRQKTNKHVFTLKMKKWSSQWTQFMQLRKEAWKKFRTSTGFEPVTSRYRCDALPTELWSHWRWEQVTLSTRSSIHACTWIIDSIDHESFVIMSWYGSTRQYHGKTKASLPPEFKFPRVFVSPCGHSVRRIRRTKSLSQNSWKYDFVIVNILVLSWLLTWYESLNSSVMFSTLFVRLA